MGRMLESLKHADTQRRGGAAPLSSVADSPTASDHTDEGVPFIEVGGPRKAIDGSKSVLAKPLSGNKPPTAQPRIAQLDMPWIVPVLSSVTPKAPSVAFRPLPLHGPFGPARERFSSELVTFHQPELALSRQYADLVESLMAQLPNESAIVFCTGGAKEAGRTTVLLNLAVAYARKGAGEVVAIDAGMGQVASKLGMPAAPGLREILMGSASLRASVRESGQPNLHALTAGSRGTDPLDGTAHERIQPVLQQLRDHFDWVLVDGPAWDDSPLTIALASAADAVYLIIPEADVKSAETTELLVRIPEHGGRLCGYIITRP
jgi:Mrp family chromosome partitioning ATPase